MWRLFLVNKMKLRTVLLSDIVGGRIHGSFPVMASGTDNVYIPPSAIATGSGYHLN
mgnify:FL=1